MVGSDAGGIAGLERVAQTEVRQDGADYNRCLEKWKDYLLRALTASDLRPQG